MLCVEIPAKQQVLIFWLDKHLVYGLSPIATAPDGNISQCISVRALGAPPAMTVPAWPPPQGSQMGAGGRPVDPRRDPLLPQAPREPYDIWSSRRAMRMLLPQAKDGFYFHL